MIFILRCLVISKGNFSVPNAPYISSQDQLSVAIANRTSITLHGILIVSSDTYAAVGMLDEGMRLPNFTRVQSVSAANNVTLDNLEPGKRYTVELVAIIGTNTDCGSENITESEISNLTICTGYYVLLTSVLTKPW